MSKELSFQDEASTLLKSLARQCATDHGIGSMSPAVYDTAWVSMIRKPQEGNRWLFPECFQFLLRSQLPDGAWESYSSQADGILNTSAALLALKKHIKDASGQPVDDLELRCSKAEAALQRLLNEWDVASCDQVGFELLVVKLLRLLQEEGVVVDFPSWKTLKALHDTKLAKLPPTSVCARKTTLLHSLEALIGHIDFDQVRHFREKNGSMLASPSSTAAYLMNVTAWDEQAEEYLRSALNCSDKNEYGSVPCAWPTTIFELTWAVTTLIECGYQVEETEASTIADFLQKSVSSNNGTVGFTPSSLPDADDSARTIMTLSYLNRSVNVKPLIDAFEATDHFRTYHGERNPSFSANCNVLSCLLTLNNPAPYAPQIQKATEFLCLHAFAETINEKWHIHDLYSVMLLSQNFVHLVACVRDESLSNEAFLGSSVVKERIPIISLQILSRVIKSQEKDGSWESKRELTAYAVLTLSALSGLPWIQSLKPDMIVPAIEKGQYFLKRNRRDWRQGDYLWIEKVTYSSSNLSHVYCLAASIVQPDHFGRPPKVPSPTSSRPLPEETHLNGMATVPLNGQSKTGKLFSSMPLLRGVSQPLLQTALLQSHFFLPHLRRRRLDVFPRAGMAKDKYLEYIPFTWTACNAMQDVSMEPSVLKEMMMVSMLNYQADEFMETVVEERLRNDLDLVKDMIRKLCSQNSQCSAASSPNAREDEAFAKETPGSDVYWALKDTKTVLSRFTAHVLSHPKVLESHPRMQTHLAKELETFLLAHVAQAEENQQFANELRENSENGFVSFKRSRRTYYDWVRNTSADHTSCPYSYVFFFCLISPRGKDPFPTARQAYLSEHLCRHLATMCRQYNDYGSIARDRTERNLNSVNFPEFRSASNTEATEKRIKDDLMWIAEYERRGLTTAMSELAQDLDGRTMSALRLFVDVTDLYGQIYVQRDIASRMK